MPSAIAKASRPHGYFAIMISCHSQGVCYMLLPTQPYVCLHNVVCGMCAALLGDTFLEGTFSSATFTQPKASLIMPSDMSAILLTEVLAKACTWIPYRRGHGSVHGFFLVCNYQADTSSCKLCLTAPLQLSLHMNSCNERSVLQPLCPQHTTHHSACRRNLQLAALPPAALLPHSLTACSFHSRSYMPTDSPSFSS